MERPSIALCMIVKNEEETLASCLRSAASLVDDMIIVDTGSTDATITIVEQFADRVHHFVWQDDFAAARNFALDHVKSDWVLWLDADEEVEVTDEEAWRRSLVQKTASADALRLSITNYTGPIASETGAYLYSNFRLLRTAADFRYKQAVHEHIDLARGNYRLDNDVVPGIRIRHYGYMDYFVDKKSKSARNIRLLQKEQMNPRYDPWIDYHLAGEYYRQGDYVAAFEGVNTAIQRFVAGGRLPPSLIYKLKYDILLVTGSGGDALPGIQRAIMLYPDYVDLHYYKGLFQFRNKQFNQAIETFTSCVRLGEDHPHLVLKGTGTYMATYMIGMCREALGDVPGAVTIYKQLAREYASYEPPQARLNKLSSKREVR